MSLFATIDDLMCVSAEDISKMPLDKIMAMQEDMANARAASEKINEALSLRFAAEAAQKRREQSKDTGSVSVIVGALKVLCDLPKKVDWDQAKLGAAVLALAEAGNDPDEFVTYEYKVSETRFAAWPSKIRAMFADARTVGVGKPKFVVSVRKD